MRKIVESLLEQIGKSNWFAVSVLVVFSMTTRVYAGEWDKRLLNAELENVHVKADSILTAWREINAKYLLRVNLYCDAETNTGSPLFSFDRDHATGKELIEACLVVYPTYTYTQDSETGVIWIHPKELKYTDILSQSIRVDRSEHQVPVYKRVYQPLIELLFPNILQEPSSLGTALPLGYSASSAESVGKTTIRLGELS